MHLEFHSQSDDQTRLFSAAGCCSRPQCGTTEQWSVYLITRSQPVRRPRLRILTRGEIWYYRWACYGVYERHGAIVAAMVDATVGAIVCQSHGNQEPRCWPWVWRYIRGQQYNIRLFRRPKDRLEALPRSKMPQHGQAAAFPELERQLVE